VKTTSTFIFLLIFNSIITDSSIACDCKPTSSIEKSFEKSNLVVHARVLSKEFIQYAETLLPNWSDSLAKWAKEKGQLLDLSTIAPNVIRIKVLVLKSYKNQSHFDTLTIFTPRSSASCGFNAFEIGKEFLVFNGSDLFKSSEFKNYNNENVQLKNTFWTNQCTRTAEVIRQDLDSLDLITAPVRVLNPNVKKCEFYIDSLTYERIYTNADILPQFKSGQIDLMDFYKSNASLPPLENEIADTSFNTQVSFIINPNGRISRIRFVNSELKSAEKAIIELIKKMPPWVPGKCGNYFISYELILNFRFNAIKVSSNE
jgi:hypothetical protein